MCQPLLSHNVVFFKESNMFLTFPASQVECPPDYRDKDATAWGMVALHTTQQGWFTVIVPKADPTATETLLSSYPSSITHIGNYIHDFKIEVSNIQCALVNKQSHCWSFHVVEEIWCLGPDSSSEDLVVFFRLEGGQGLLDSSGNFVELNPGDQMELIYKNRQTDPCLQSAV